jgi:hypothetical protein
MRNISSKTKKKIVAKQKYRCNNQPKAELRNLEGFQCPLWESTEFPGVFDEKGYEIDHIIEYALTQNISEENLQALCIVCHREKTRRFMQSHNRNKKYSGCSSKRVTTKKASKSGTKRKSINGRLKVSENVKERREVCIVDDKYICADCNKTFATKQGWEYHVDKKVCHKPKGVICSYCNKEFTARSSLSRHKKSFCKLRPELNEPPEPEVQDDIVQEGGAEPVNEMDMVRVCRMLIELQEQNITLRKQCDELEQRVSKSDKNMNE